MPEPTESLLERDLSEENCATIVDYLRDLADHKGFRVLVRECQVREQVALQSLRRCTGDTLREFGHLQGTAQSYSEMVGLVNELIDGLNERRETLQAERRPQEAPAALTRPLSGARRAAAPASGSVRIVEHAGP